MKPLSEPELIRASRDKKYVVARWKRRVALSEKKLKKTLDNPSLSRQFKEEEKTLHYNRLKKYKSLKKELNNISD